MYGGCVLLDHGLLARVRNRLVEHFLGRLQRIFPTYVWLMIATVFVFFFVIFTPELQAENCYQANTQQQEAGARSNPYDHLCVRKVTSIPLSRFHHIIVRFRCSWNVPWETGARIEGGSIDDGFLGNLILLVERVWEQIHGDFWLVVVLIKNLKAI